MEAVELTTKTDENGSLNLNLKSNHKNKGVRVIILFESNDTHEDEDLLLYRSLNTNPAFDFLVDESEDIYTISDGISIND